MTNTTAPAKGVTTEETGLDVRTEVTAELQATPESARAVAEIRGAILMARHFPRDVDKNIVDIRKLCSRARFAAEAGYSFPRGGTTVEGPSVNLARGAAAIWGNIKYGKRVIRDDGETIVIEAFAWDMERNSYVTDQTEFANLIFRKGKGWIKPDERDKRELINRHGAIAERNCLLKILPRDIVDEAFELCKKVVKQGVTKDRESFIRDMLMKFSEIGVAKDQLEEWLAGHRDDDSADIRTISDDEANVLRGIFNSITDGNSKMSEYFKPKSRTGASEKGKLDPESMKPGDASTNKGHDQAPKPSDRVPTEAEKQRIQIREIANTIAEGDVAKSAELLADWTGRQDLDKMAGDDLGIVHQTALDERIKWSKKNERTR